MHGHKLTTVMIRTESFEGYPVMQMISLDECLSTCVKLFESLSRIVSNPPKYLVSDDFPNYINAANIVFGNIELK